MQKFARFTSPVVRLLAWSTDLVFRLVPIRRSDEGTVTEEEIKSLIEQGTQAGIVAEAEQGIVEAVFKLGDRRVAELMTPRLNIVWIEVSEKIEEIRRTIADNRFSRFPVCEEGIDHIIGVVHVKDLFVSANQTGEFDLRRILREPSFVPESVQALNLVETLRNSGTEMAFVVDEHGGLQGLLTMADLVEPLIGRLTEHGSEKPFERAIQREDGSWLVDGRFPISQLEEIVGQGGIQHGDGSYNTVGGLVMAHLGKIPRVADRVEIDRVLFEILDMDVNRIDKVLVTLPTSDNAASKESSEE
jgi:putative hemolysin